MLPLIKGGDVSFQLMQTKWASELNPLLINPLSSPNILKNVQLVNGTTVVNHLLGRTMQGWIISDKQGPTTIYRTAPFNNLTLTLVSSADCVVDLVVF